MKSFREEVKKRTPRLAREFYIRMRERLAPLPPEETMLHPYAMRFIENDALRLTLVVPSLAPEIMFGGIATAVKIFLECGKRAGADLRIVLDDFEPRIALDFIENSAERANVDFKSIAICPRTADIQPIETRRNDIFIAYNWYLALNLNVLITRQRDHFGGARSPLIYLIQEYEPAFYAFSSTHLFARMAFDLKERVWGVFNSSQLHAYFRIQGHAFEREYIFEPRLPSGMLPYLNAKTPTKDKTILVYGRPNVPRNCFSAIVAGLRAWSERYPEFESWSVVSAGTTHRPVPIGRRLTLKSLGKLSIERYSECLLKTAIGVSLMASPHPSYPPLEMAHFGVRTLTNRYLCKELSASHDNIVSLPDIWPNTIADALASECKRFESAPWSGWQGQSHMPSYLAQSAFPFIDDLAKDILDRPVTADLHRARFAEGPENAGAIIPH